MSCRKQGLRKQLQESPCSSTQMAIWWSRQPWLSPGHLLPPALPASDLCGTLGRYKVISYLKLRKQGFPTLDLLKVRLKGVKELLKVNQSSAQCRHIRHFFCCSPGSSLCGTLKTPSTLSTVRLDLYRVVLLRLCTHSDSCPRCGGVRDCCARARFLLCCCGCTNKALEGLARGQMRGTFAVVSCCPFQLSLLRILYPCPT